MAENRNSSTILAANNYVIVAKVSPQTILLKSSDGVEITQQNVIASKNINTLEVAITTVENAVTAVANDYDNVGLVSLDGIFCPYIIKQSGGSHSNLPYWELPTDTGGIYSYKLNPFNPDNIFYDLSGNFNPTRFYESGHNINLVNNLSGVGEETDGDLNAYKELAYHNLVQYSSGIRGVGLRGPLIISGPCYDIDGKPVPADTGDPNKFAPDAFRNPSKWPSGPVDLRWDNNRKLYVTGTNGTVKIRFSIHEADCESCSAVVKILSRTNGVSTVPEEFELKNGDQYYMEENEEGDSVRSKFVTVYDKIGILNESNINLQGRIGYAEYMYGRPKCNYQPWLGWEVTALAEQQTECEI